MMRLVALLSLLVSSACFAQAGSDQSFQPFNNDYLIITGAGSSGYNYGYPAFGSIEPNVKAQFLMEEASGDLTDQVSGIVVAATAGTATYSVDATGLFAGISTGITTASNIRFAKLAATASLNVGASDHFVVEWWDASSANTANMYTWGYNRTDTTTHGILAYHPSATTMVVDISCDGGVLGISKTFTITNWYDGIPHKFRLVVNRSSNMELFLDGVSQGTQATLGMATGTLTNSGLTISTQFNGGALSLAGTKFEWRMSIGTDVLSNNSGGPGGG